jgi:hypothetical protein
LVHAAVVSAKVTIANTSSLRIVIIVPPITISGASGSGVRRSRVDVDRPKRMITA